MDVLAASPSSPPPAALELVGVSCVRGNRRLFEGIDVALHGGQLLRVLGANGSGKTTLLRTLCGLATPDRGEVRWNGCALARQRDEFHGDLIYIGHAAALKDDLSAFENMRTACLVGGQRPTPQALLHALASAGLLQREHLSARSLSQGQRRRIALARLLLAPSPRLWVLDEPFNALDVAASDWLAGVLAHQLRRGGIVVLTSHQPVALDPSLQQVTLAL